jgi:WD40 repeat protein
MDIRIKNKTDCFVSLFLFFAAALILVGCGSPLETQPDSSSQFTGQIPSNQTTVSASMAAGTKELPATAPAILPSTTAIPLPPSGNWSITAETSDQIQNLFELRLSKTGKILDIAWSPDGSQLAALGSAGIILLNGETLEILHELEVTGKYTSISFSADNHLLAATDASSLQTQIWNIKDFTTLQIIPETGNISAISNDGKILAAVEDVQQLTADGYLGPMQTILRLFEVGSGKLIRESSTTFKVTEWNIEYPETIGIYFSADNETLQTVNLLGDVRLWNAKNGSLLKTSINPYTRERLSSGYCQTDGTNGKSFSVMCYIVYIDPPCTESTPGCNPNFTSRYEVGLWDANRLIRSRNLVIKDVEVLFSNMAYSPETNSVNLFSENAIQTWNLNTGLLERTIEKKSKNYPWHASEFSCPICLSPLLAIKPGSAGSIMAFVNEGNIILWNSINETEIAKTELELRQVTSADLGILNDKPVLGVGLSDGSIVLLNPDTNTVLQTINQAHTAEVSNIAFGSDGNTLISTGDQSIHWWDLSASKQIRTEKYDYRSEFYANSRADVLAISQDQFDNNNYLVDSQLELKELLTGKTYQVFENWVANIALSLDGKWLATEKLEKISLWNPNGELLRQFDKIPDDGYVSTIALSSDGSLLGIAQRNILYLVDVNTRAIVAQAEAGSGISRIIFSPSDCLAAIGDKNGTIFLLDIKNKHITHHWHAHAGSINLLTFSQDGRLLLSQGSDGAARIWGQSSAVGLPPGEPVTQVCKFASPPMTSTPVTPTATSTPITPTPSPTQVTYYRTLKLTDPAMVGNDVLQLQRRLTEYGYTQIGSPDGVFGPKTDIAVRQYQKDNGLVVDGIVGPVTWQQLFGN